MYCKYCGQLNIAKAHFCKSCGGKITKQPWLKANRLKIGLSFGVLIVAIGLWVNAGYASDYVNIFPFIKTSPKIVTYSCAYAGKNLQVQSTTYSNINNYYKNYNYSEKEDYIKQNQFQKFTYINPRDKAIEELVENIKKVGKANNFSDDQTLELGLCFMQNIPYDDNKANSVLSNNVGNNSDTEQYPYQTLYLNKGICTDKTYLGSVVARDLGYGTALFGFSQKNHMALGVFAPNGYTSFASPYVYVEMTSKWPVGQAPESIDPNNGRPVGTINSLKPLSTNDDPSKITISQNKSINAPELTLPVSGGKNYSRIVAIRSLEKNIGEFIAVLIDQKGKIDKEYGNISYWNRIQSQNYAEYLATPATTQTCMPYFSLYGSYNRCYSSSNFMKSIKYSSYTSSLNNYNAAVKNYNSYLSTYNSNIDKLKVLMDKWDTYQY